MNKSISTSWPVFLLAVALALFFAKQGLASKPTELPWQKSEQHANGNPGRIAWADAGDHYLLYFSEQPKPVIGLGWTAALTTTATWHIRCDEPGGEIIEVKGSPKDTVKIYAGGAVFVTCSVTYTFEAIPPKTGSVLPIYFTGMDTVDCIQLIAPPTPPDDPAPIDTTITTVQPPLPQNLYSVQDGVVSLQGQKGVLVVFDYHTLLPIAAVEFQEALAYDLKQFGSGLYIANAIFANPAEVVELGVIEL